MLKALVFVVGSIRDIPFINFEDEIGSGYGGIAKMNNV